MLFILKSVGLEKVWLEHDRVIRIGNAELICNLALNWK